MLGELSLSDVESFWSLCLFGKGHLVVGIVGFLDELTDQVVPAVAISGRAKPSLLPAEVDIGKSATAFPSEAMMADWAMRDEVDGARKGIRCSRGVLCQ